MKPLRWFFLSLFVLGGLGSSLVFADSPAPEEVPLLSGQALQDKIQNAKGPLVLDFWAIWCGPCQVFSPIVAEVSQKYQGQMEFYRVNVSAQENDPVVSANGIQVIPTLIVYEKGKPVARWSGLLKKSVLQKHLDKVLADWRKSSLK